MFGSELQLAPLVFWELLLTGGSECGARPMDAYLWPFVISTLLPLLGLRILLMSAIMKLQLNW